MKAQTIFKKTIQSIIVVLLFSSVNLFAQNNFGSIKGKLTDGSNGDPLPFANVVLLQADSQLTGVLSDFEGKFIFKNLKSGKYNVQVSFVGYNPS